MRPLIVSALAATLTGCTWFAPQQSQQESRMGHSTAGTPRTNSNTVAKAEMGIDVNAGHLRHRRKANSDTKIAKPDTVPKIDAASCIQADDKSSASINAKPTVAAKTETPQSSQSEDKSDPVLKKAMPAIAAKMESSASVELVEMKRADKNALGKSIDTICGYVRGKNTTGSETGDKPFLYLVREDVAYVGGYNMATSPYHNLCDK